MLHVNINEVCPAGNQTCSKYVLICLTFDNKCLTRFNFAKYLDAELDIFYIRSNYLRSNPFIVIPIAPDYHFLSIYLSDIETYITLFLNRDLIF